jgi:sulfotransferase
MDKKYHFISGLPRSGSTLLVALLNQNPRFHAEITNSLKSCYHIILPTIYSYPERIVSSDEAKIKRVLQSIVDAYYHDVDKEVIFNVDRGWTNVIDQLNVTHENSKIICCVRSLNWIIDSFELAYNKRGLTIPKMHQLNHDNLQSRIRNIFPEGPLYKNYYDLMQAYYGPFKDKLLIVEYDDLVKTPKETINKIYQFIGEEEFAHDFDNVKSNVEDFDDKLNFPGLHKIRSKVEYKERETILPPEIFDKFKNMEFWRK